ncbi:uncharacterized protein LOC122357351 isoform X2 [Puntigrus tetrazona]|uniref:uncharacterized protein LOC122357351 isoform X2 n=1 Tax=Puntigrus tetrazona TaxID=1606681 RepID=UPI001C8A4CF0|nr:uncharacterized protein LOC122357351 isoform X2 [Puntigrus tetrazona]
MPESTNVIITSPLYQHQQYEISRFLHNQPLVLGILEILVALLAFVLTICNKTFFLIWIPIIFVIIGAITISAAQTRKPCLVKTSQILSYVSFALVALSLLLHLVFILGISDVSSFVLVACDIMIFVISLAVAITSCSCCGRPQSTPAMVSYMTTDLPVNSIMPYRSAEGQPVGSVIYVLPPVPLPNYSHVPSASPPMYSLLPTTSPSNYDKVSGALPPNYSAVPSAPPPAYEEYFQTRR